jgi:hypothetical protein
MIIIINNTIHSQSGHDTLIENITRKTTIEI